MTKNNLNNINIGNCGEYYVAGELERRGFTVAVPMSNVDNFDILARNNKTHKQYAIQVKTTTKNSWILNKKAENLSAPDIYYVFVRIKGDNHPEFFIYESEYVANYVQKHHQQWLSTTTKNGEKHNDTSIRSFRDFSNKDRWDLLD